jgi:hypothetical protein
VDRTQKQLRVLELEAEPDWRSLGEWARMRELVQNAGARYMCIEIRARTK